MPSHIPLFSFARMANIGGPFHQCRSRSRGMSLESTFVIDERRVVWRLSQQWANFLTCRKGAELRQCHSAGIA